MTENKTYIDIQVQDQKLVALANPVLASGGVNETDIRFDISEEWEGMVLTAVFFNENDKTAVYYAILDEDRCAVVPQEVLKDDGYIQFGLCGVLEDTVRTSEMMRYRVVLGAMAGEGSPSDPTPDLWQQILAQLNSVLPVVQELKSDLEEFKNETEANFDSIKAMTEAEIDAAINAAG